MLYELKNIVREFKGRKILDIPELWIEAGKIHTLIGPNGAGKTTLLNVLAFLDKPDSGNVQFAGEQLTYSAKQLLSLRRRVVLLDQYPILFTGPVWKNVEYGLKVRGISTAEREGRVKEMLALVGMQRFVEADAHKLSGGETKRVALARALAVRPEVLLCDEPGANVDKENQEIILGILERINHEEKTSVIFSTHYLSQGRRLADNTLMLEHGMLTDMVNENIFRCSMVSRENGRITCHVAGCLLSFPEHLLPYDMVEFKLHVDPERVVYSPDDLSFGEKNVLTGHVIQINQDRGRIRIGIEVGFKLFFFLSMKDYRKAPPIIGGKVAVYLPDSSLRCSFL